MDIRSYFGPLKRKFWLIVLIALLTGLVTSLFTWKYAPTIYKGELYITIASTDDQQTEDYKYGNYYANYASIEFARTLSGWMESGGFVDSVYKDAQVNLSDDQDIFGKLFGAIRSKRVERANILLSYRSKNPENADRIMASLRDNLTELINGYNNSAATKYTIANPQDQIIESKPNISLNTIIGLIAGLMLGVLLAYLIEFFGRVLISPDQVEDYLGIEPTFILNRYDNTLPDILAAHIDSYKEPVLLVGATLDPSGLAVKIASPLRALTGKVTLVEGQQKLHLSSKAGYSRKATGWSDEFKKQNRSNSTLKLTSRLTKSIGTHISVAGFGRFNQASISRVLNSNDAGMVGVISFPIGSRQLADLPENTPLIIVAQLGRTKQRDLGHIRTFLKDHPASIVLLA